MDCYICDSLTGRKRISPGPMIYEGKHWIIDHAYPTKLLGWLVIVLKRHVQSLHELTKEEFKEMGELQEKTIKIFYKELHSKKEYLACFSEQEHFKHIHLHIIPIKTELPESLKGPNIFTMIEIEKKNAISPEKIIEFSKNLRNKFNLV